MSGIPKIDISEFKEMADYTKRSMAETTRTMPKPSSVSLEEMNYKQDAQLELIEAMLDRLDKAEKGAKSDRHINIAILVLTSVTVILTIASFVIGLV